MDVRRNTERGLLASLGLAPMGAFVEKFPRWDKVEDEERDIIVGLGLFLFSWVWAIFHFEGKLNVEPTDPNRLLANGDLERRILWYGDGGLGGAMGVEGEERNDKGEGGIIVVGVVGALWDSNWFLEWKSLEGDDGYPRIA